MCKIVILCKGGHIKNGFFSMSTWSNFLWKPEEWTSLPIFKIIKKDFQTKNTKIHSTFLNLGIK